MVISVVLLGVTVYLFGIVPKGFLPSEDQGRFNVNTEGAQGISFDEMVRHHQRVADILMAEPSILGVSSNVGPIGNNATGGSNQGRIFVEMKPREQRRESVDEIIQRCGLGWRRFRACACSWSTSRRSISAAAAAGSGPSISSRCRIPTPRSSTSGRR
jgi:multidrug efflux pump subunit AcrB